MAGADVLDVARDRILMMLPVGGLMSIFFGYISGVLGELVRQ